MSELLKKTIGESWITNLYQLKKLEKFSEDASFQEEFLTVKKKNKEILARLILEICRVKIDSDSLFDIQAKRIHEYKRQLLNVMGIIYHYLKFIEGEPIDERVSRKRECTGSVSDEGLARAMKKAIELGLAPKEANLDDYSKWWNGMKSCIEAAISD